MLGPALALLLLSAPPSILDAIEGRMAPPPPPIFEVQPPIFLDLPEDPAPEPAREIWAPEPTPARASDNEEATREVKPAAPRRQAPQPRRYAPPPADDWYLISLPDGRAVRVRGTRGPDGRITPTHPVEFGPPVHQTQWGTVYLAPMSMGNSCPGGVCYPGRRRR